MEIVLASGNRGKLRELSRALNAFGVVLRPQSDFAVTDAVEDGSTFEQNALIKARHAARLSGRPALADDSGLCVDALGGRPGVRSARYAGAGASDQANVELLLQELENRNDRSAHFTCTLALVRSVDDAAPLVVSGHWRGAIADAPRGDNGFGYDPVFVDPETGMTAAELAPEAKSAISHRGQAIKELERAFQDWLAD